MRRLLLGAATAALSLVCLSGCALPGADPSGPGAGVTVPAGPPPPSGPSGPPQGGSNPPPGITFDGGPGAAAYLACRQQAISAGTMTVVTEPTIDEACAEKAEQ